MRKQIPLQLWLMVAMLALGSCGLYAQDLLVRGAVTSAATGEPLQEVNVMVKGSNNETLSGKDGSFEIKVPQSFYTPSPPPVLTFSAADYETLEIEVLGKSKVDAALVNKSSKLSGLILSGTAAGQSEMLMSYAVGNPGEELIGFASPPLS